MMGPKFRAWYKNDNEMISWSSLLYGHNLRNVFMRPDMCGLILMQSTELNDKLGEEIWHKDILDETIVNPFSRKEEVNRYVVDKKDGMWVLTDSKGLQRHDEFLFKKNSRCVKVGNIFENSELLEKSHES